MREGTIIDGRLNDLMLFSFLKACSSATLGALARGGVWSVHEPGRVLFLQGDECASWFLVSSGRIALSFASDNGREVTVGQAGPGETLGDIELVSGRCHLTNGVAIEPTRLFVLRRGVFAELLRDPAFSAALLRSICLRWCRLAAFAETMTLHSLEQRLASLLLDLRRSHGRPVHGGTLIHPTMSQTEMARLINASRPKVNVRLQSWKDAALIGLDRHGILVRDARALAAIAASTS